MITATLEEIHADPHRLDVWIAAGESVSVMKNGRRIARVLPETTAANSGTSNWPDFRSRLKAI